MSKKWSQLNVSRAYWTLLDGLEEMDRLDEEIERLGVAIQGLATKSGIGTLSTAVICTLMRAALVWRLQTWITTRARTLWLGGETVDVDGA